MPENTTTTGLLRDSLAEVSGELTDLSEEAVRIDEICERLSERLFGTGGAITSPRTVELGPDEYWELDRIRLGLVALANGADLARADAHIAEDHAEDLAELVRVVEKLRT